MSDSVTVPPRVLEAIAHNVCSLHGFDPAWVAGQERFAKAVITEYLRAAAPPTEAQEAWREKVADAVLDACRQYVDTDRGYVGERKAVHTGYIITEATDAILALLPHRNAADAHTAPETVND